MYIIFKKRKRCGEFCQYYSKYFFVLGWCRGIALQRLLRNWRCIQLHGKVFKDKQVGYIDNMVETAMQKHCHTENNVITIRCVALQSKDVAVQHLYGRRHYQLGEKRLCK